MDVLVSGSSGFIGSALLTGLRSRGHGVTRLVRSNPAANDVLWDPATGTIDSAGLEGIDAVVHLAGRGMGDRRWNDTHKARILDSRVRGTRLLAETLASMTRRPRVLVSASAVGYYGDRGSEKLTEQSSQGSGFLAEVCGHWEASAEPARAAGIREAHIRSGLVLNPAGGLLGRLLLPFRVGLGGPLGSGHQYWSWIALSDEVGAIIHIIENDDARGAFNLTAPNPVMQGEFAAVLGRALRRPTVVPAPAGALRLVLGAEMAQEIILSSQRAFPEALISAGYNFEHTELDPTLRAMLTSS
jgi:uncharacterized protein (TIGR01777 family)